MNHRYVILWTLVVVLGLPSALRAQDTPGRTGTGQELLQDCTLYFSFLGRTGAGRAETFEEDPFGMGYCAGLVRGVANSANTFHPDLVCRLDGVGIDSAVRAVVRYLTDYPESQNQPDTVLVLRALQDAFICATR